MHDVFSSFRLPGSTRAPFALGSCVLLLMSLGCCHKCDLVEAELRTKDNELRELKARLQQSELLSQALERDVVVPGQNIASKPALPAGFPTYSLKQIVLGRQTGGYDVDAGHPDSALQVVVEPRDIDDQAIKVPGSLAVDTFQVSPEGLKTPLSSWEIPPDALRRSWKNGILSSGYHVILPWKVWPTAERLRVVVRFSSADGRVFEADKDVTIRVPGVSGLRPAVQ